MKRRLAFILALFILGTAFVSCAKNDGNDMKKDGEKTQAETTFNPDCQRVAGIYTRANDEPAFGAFHITLHPDGTCQYTEALISSYLGFGRYKVEGDIVTIEEGGIMTDSERLQTFRFRHKEGKLSYIAEGSDKFMYVELEDGAEFTWQCEPIEISIYG